MSSERILIIEDDPDIAFLLDRAMRKEGFETEVLHSASNLRPCVARFKPHLVLLDLMLPDSDGYSVCRQVKESAADREIKVIMLTAKSEEEDILNGFRVGADDFVTKPFHVQEVTARSKAVLRRRRTSPAAQRTRRVNQGAISIDDTKHEVRLHGRPLNLTISEYRILRLLAGQPERVYTREQLSSAISDSDRPAQQASSSRNIDVHIRSLRKKLGDESVAIQTLRGVGYYYRKATEQVGSP